MGKTSQLSNSIKTVHHDNPTPKPERITLLDPDSNELLIVAIVRGILAELVFPKSFREMG